MGYKYILFDLDGTLTDPGLGITNSVMYALEKYNIKVKNREELYCFIGPPLIESFKNYYNFSNEQAQEAVAYYREYFSDKGIFENVVYDGIENLLRKLKNAGREIFLATSKPENFAVQILEHFDLAKYFNYIGGSTLDEERNSKLAVMSYVIKTCNLENKKDIVMVGDRKYDIEAANACGLDSVAVLFGYGNEEELRKAQAGAIAETVKDLTEILI